MGRADHHGDQPGCDGRRFIGRPDTGGRQKRRIDLRAESPQDLTLFVRSYGGALGVRCRGGVYGDVELKHVKHGNACVGGEYILHQSDGQLGGVGSRGDQRDDGVCEWGRGDRRE